MEGILIEYQILFMMMIFILFILTVFMLFIDASVEKTTMSMIFIFINLILCIIAYYSFHAVDIYGFDSSGEVVRNVLTDQFPLSFVYVGFFYVNIMLAFYCPYLYIRKPWEEYDKSRPPEELPW